MIPFQFVVQVAHRVRCCFFRPNGPSKGFPEWSSTMENLNHEVAHAHSIPARDLCFSSRSISFFHLNSVLERPFRNVERDGKRSSPLLCQRQQGSRSSSPESFRRWQQRYRCDMKGSPSSLPIRGKMIRSCGDYIEASTLDHRGVRSSCRKSFRLEPLATT